MEFTSMFSLLSGRMFIPKPQLYNPIANVFNSKVQRPQLNSKSSVPIILGHFAIFLWHVASSLFPLIFSVSDPQQQVQFFNCPPWFLRYGLSLGQGAQPRDLSLLPQTWYYKCKPLHLYVSARTKPKGSLVCVREALYLLGSIPSPGLVFYLCPL